MFAPHAARVARTLALALAASTLAACGSLPSWMPWVSQKSKRPDAPAVSQTQASRVAWSVRLGQAGVGFAPVVAGGSVFTAGADGTVARIDAANGAVLWRERLGVALAGGVGSDGEVVVVTARDGSLIALENDGRKKWSVPLGTEATSLPAVGDGVVVVRTADNRVSAFDADSGRRRWSFQRQNPPLVLRQTGAITIERSTAFAGLPGGRLVALDVRTGAVRWEATIAQSRGATEIERIADLVGAPIVSGRELCAVAFQGRLACLDIESGRQRWSREFSSSRGLDLDARLLAATDAKDVVFAYSRDGESMWKQEQLTGRSLSAPASLGPVMVVGDLEGYVYLLSREDGRLVARFSSDGTPVVASPVVAGPAAIVQTAGGTLLSVTLE